MNWHMESKLRVLGWLLLVPASALGVFAAWGMFTAGGHRQYDEMDGMIPYFAGLGALVLGVAACLSWAVSGLLRAKGSGVTRLTIDD